MSFCAIRLNMIDMLNCLPLCHKYVIYKPLLFTIFFFSVVIILDVVWLSLGIAWLVKFYMTCPVNEAKEIMLGK